MIRLSLFTTCLVLMANETAFAKRRQTLAQPPVEHGVDSVVIDDNDLDDETFNEPRDLSQNKPDFNAIDFTEGMKSAESDSSPLFWIANTADSLPLANQFRLRQRILKLGKFSDQLGEYFRRELKVKPPGDSVLLVFFFIVCSYLPALFLAILISCLGGSKKSGPINDSSLYRYNAQDIQDIGMCLTALKKVQADISGLKTHLDNNGQSNQAGGNDKQVIEMVNQSCRSVDRLAESVGSVQNQLMAQQRMITEMEARFNKNFALMLTELQKKNQMMSEFDPRDASPGSRFSSRPSSAQGILTERQILDKSQPKDKPVKVQAPERGPSSDKKASLTKLQAAAQQRTSKPSQDKPKKDEEEEEEYYDEEDYDAEDAA